MKFSLILVLLTGFLLPRSETFFVLGIKGEIFLERNKALIHKGDKIDADDKVIFADSHSIASVISSERGRLVLSAKKAKKDKGGELKAVIKDNLYPAQKRLSTRHGEVPTNEMELKKFFSPKNKDFLIIDEGRYRLPGDIFPQNEQNFFYIRYTYKGKEINKKLGFEGEILIINPNIYEIDGYKIDKEEADHLKLCYYYLESGKYKSKYFIDFDPLFIEGDELRSEIRLMIENLSSSGNSNAEIYEDIYAHLDEFYGKPSHAHLKDWLKEVFQFSVEKK